MADDSQLTPPGWPRPVHDGWPVPWVSPKSDLSQMDGDRKLELLRDRLCQVCGLGHEAGTRAFLCVTAHPKVGEEVRSSPAETGHVAVQAMDDAVMPERCLRLALGRCPHLVELATTGWLLVVSARVEDFDFRDVVMVDAGKFAVETSYR